MCKINKKSGLKIIDKCLRHAISTLDARELETVACCCGHGRYKMTIVHKGKSGGFFELFSGLQIPRKRRFYRKDKDGYYYIPEVENDTKNN